MNQTLRLFALGALLVTTLFFGVAASAQTIPQRFSYQAIARDASGAPLANTAVGVRISILDGSPLGSVEYMETHTAVTNPFGLLILQVGGGQAFLGNFSEVEWAGGLKWLRVEIDASGGTEYEPLGTSQLLSVPYALAAAKPTDLRLNELSDVAETVPTAGQSLVWNGTSWAPGSGVGSSISVSPRLSGNGTSGSPLDIARQDAEVGQVLEWNGIDWRPAEDDGRNLTAGPGLRLDNDVLSTVAHTGDVTGTIDLTVVGLQGRRVSSLGPVGGQVLKWNDATNAWTPATDNSLALIAGNGLEIIGQTIRNTVWTVSGANIYRVGGNVGIGTGTPVEQLHMTGSIRFDGMLKPDGLAGIDGQVLTSRGPSTSPQWMNVSDLLDNSAWLTTGNTGTNPPSSFIGTIDTKPLVFKTGDVERLRITETGNVGIGATTPTAQLDVNGTTGYNQLRLRTSYTPTGTSDANGSVGDVSWDNNYIYVRTGAGWKRAALSTW